MLKNIFNVSIAIMSIFATDVFANDECKKEAEVTGTIDTINVSQSIQVGTIHLILSDADDGEVVFDEKGGIIGRITSQEGLKSTLDHHIFLADGSGIETTDDEAQIIGDDGTGCSFAVTETITKLWGTKKFKRASGTIYATGTISFCEGANGNHFTLQGTVCLK